MKHAQTVVGLGALAMFLATLVWSPWEVSTRDGKRTFYAYAPIWSTPRPPSGFLETSFGSDMPAAPNRMVQWWRSNNVSDARSDDEITVALSLKYPETFRYYPDAVSDLDRIAGAESKLRKKLNDYAAISDHEDYFIGLRDGTLNMQVRYGAMVVWWIAIGVLASGAVFVIKTVNKVSTCDDK